MIRQKKRTFRKNAYIYIEGDEDIDNIYIIEKGRVGFTGSNIQIKRYKSEAKEGNIIGFVSALSGRPRIETAYALTDCVLIELTKENFLRLLQKNSEIAFKVINYFAEELRIYDEMIFGNKDSADIQTCETDLFELGKFYINRNNYDYAYYIFNRHLQLYPESLYKDESRKYILQIESTGMRKIPEPVREGIYLRYVDKQIIFCENEPGDELFIIQEGKVKIVKNHRGTEIMLSILKEGDIFGELAIVSSKERNATAISFGNAVLMPLNIKSLIALMDITGEILKKIFTSISKRVWFTFIRIESKLHKKPLTRIFAFLENKLLEENISLKSKKPHTFNFGIDELLKMTDVSWEKAGNSINEFLKDPSLSFHFGQIEIADPSYISVKARFYRSRDHIESPDENNRPKDEKEGLENKPNNPAYS